MSLQEKCHELHKVFSLHLFFSISTMIEKYGHGVTSELHNICPIEVLQKAHIFRILTNIVWIPSPQKCTSGQRDVIICHQFPKSLKDRNSLPSVAY